VKVMKIQEGPILTLPKTEAARHAVNLEIRRLTELRDANQYFAPEVVAEYDVQIMVFLRLLKDSSIRTHDLSRELAEKMRLYNPNVFSKGCFVADELCQHFQNSFKRDMAAEEKQSIGRNSLLVLAKDKDMRGILRSQILRLENGLNRCSDKEGNRVFELDLYPKMKIDVLKQLLEKGSLNTQNLLSELTKRYRSDYSVYAFNDACEFASEFCQTIIL